MSLFESPDPQPEAEEKSGGGSDRLWDEYKLVQAKLDKVGDNRFKIKSWSATLMGALLIGGGATDKPGAALISGLAIAFSFHLSELRQRALERRFSARALSLERAFLSFPPIADRKQWGAAKRRVPEMRFVPGIAFALAARERRVVPARLGKGKPEPEASGAPEKPAANQSRAPRNRSILATLIEQSDDAFYIIQYILLVAMLFVVSLKGLMETPKKPRYEIESQKGGYKVYETNH
jgi:hypothetical protein